MPKKISVIISDDIIRKIEDAGLKQTEAVVRALELYFSEDPQKISEYKNQMNLAHISQVQTLITQMENERRSREEIIRKKEEKILLLEDGKKKKWWKIW